MLTVADVNTMPDYYPGDLVWFDPGIGYVLPGEVVEFSRPAQVISVQALINGKAQQFTLHNLSSVQKRQDLGISGVDDMIKLGDLNEASLLWNLKIRYEKDNIYTYTGSILVSVNPYKISDIYGLDVVKKYEGQILGTLPPHLFAIGSAAYSRINKDNENQVVIISGESGSGKTESTKLTMQYLAAVNKSPSNLITEQILEASPLLESFGNAKTVRNDNSSRFGKYLEVHFKDGVITGAKITEYLLEKSRIVTQASEERNYHVFYEMLAGLSDQEKEKYGVQTAEKYFYLNQGGNPEIATKDDGENFRSLLAAMQVLGFTLEEQDTIFRILAAVLHLGNVYFHRKQLKHGQEGVEIGSDAEIRWVSHLLKLSVDGILRALTSRTTETRNERMITPLNIDQALDARDAVAKSLYSSLFSWLVQRINKIVCKGDKKISIAILDIFGFEDFKENSFEQLCINNANENLQFHFNKHVFKLEQLEYAREKIDWQAINFTDNQPVLNLIGKKPVGIFPLLDDESNFPKATDLSFLEKCHYNHALNELYSRPRMSSMEFGIRHYAGQVWYSVDGFLDKNRDTLRGDVMDLLVSSQLTMISSIFKELRSVNEAAKVSNRSDGRFVTMKPRTPTVAARFQDSLTALLETMSKCNPWFVRCVKPNNDKVESKFDMPIVLEQLRYTGMLETIRIRKLGYPVRLPFRQFSDRYRCLGPGRLPRGAPPKEICKVIMERVEESKDNYQLGASKIFMRESLEQTLETERVRVLRGSVVTIQRYVRGYLSKNRYTKMRKSALVIQKNYKGYRERTRYLKIRKGFLRAQANYRMIRQKREYEKIKAILARKHEADRVALERAKERAAREEQERVSRAVAGVNHLEIPAELAFIFSKLEDWQCTQNERNVVKCLGQVAKTLPRHQRRRLPGDVDMHAFTKFTNVYFKAHIWAMKREPIKTPFLAKSNEADYQESLAIFKLILRFMNDNNLSGKKERALGDYIVQKGLQNEAMRDEILCQLCNQTWKNENTANSERGWLLMVNCLSCFAPSPTLYKYQLKYVSDCALDGYKGFCQNKLLQSEKIEPQNVRTYPPCLLEWKSNTRKNNMALEANFADGGSLPGPVESWTTGEEFTESILKQRGIEDAFGWSVDLYDDGDCYELNGYDYVLDLISETEIPPAFPVCKSFFLVSANKLKTEPGIRKTSWTTSSPHNPNRVNTFEIEVDEALPAPIRHRDPSPIHKFPTRQHNTHLHPSGSIPVPAPLLPPPPPSGPRHREERAELHASHTSVFAQIQEDLHRRISPQQKLKSRSLDQLLDDPNASMDNGLSKSSALNGRYFDSKTASSTALDSQIRPSSRKPEPPPLAVPSRTISDGQSSTAGLSETSKLNKRYLKPKDNPPKPPIRQLSEPPKSLEVHRPTSPPPPVPAVPNTSLSMREPTDPWQELGLSTSALNGRYFVRDGQKLSKHSSSDLNHSRISLDESSSHLNGHSVNGKQHKPRHHHHGHHSRHSEMSRHLDEEGSMRLSPRPSSRNSNGGIDFPELDIGDIHGVDASSHDLDQDGSRYGRHSENTRYVKYNAKQAQPKIYSHSTKAHIDRSRELDYSGARSSALSDTSEAPSLASHVKNVRIPSHTSDLDQYLDDLFNPVLDGDLDELSDARSLATAIKGGSDTLGFLERVQKRNPNMSKLSLDIGNQRKWKPPSQPPQPTRKEIKSEASEHQSYEQLSPTSKFMNHVFDNLFDDEFPDLQNPEKLSHAMKGGRKLKNPSNKSVQDYKPTEDENLNLDQYLDDLFRPVLLNEDIYGLENAQSMASALKGGGQLAGGGLEMQQPIPGMVTSGPLGYNMPIGVSPGYPMSPNLMNMPVNPGFNGMASLGPAPTINTNLSMFNLGSSPPGMNVPMVDTSQLFQQQFVQQHMMQMHQRAFLASAVQQNLQIQQQLLQQNQALHHLLQTAVVSPTTPPENGSTLLTEAPTQNSSNLLNQTAALSMALQSQGIPMPGQLGGFGTPNSSFQMPPGTSQPIPVPPKTAPKHQMSFSSTSSSKRDLDFSGRTGQSSFTPKDVFGDVLSELRIKAGNDDVQQQAFSRAQAPRMLGIPPPPPPPPPPPMPDEYGKYPDVYGRAKTVRIGKWRWPPPREDGTPHPPGYNPPAPMMMAPDGSISQEYIQAYHQEQQRQMMMSKKKDSKQELGNHPHQKHQAAVDGYIDFPEIPDLAQVEPPSSMMGKRSISEPMLQEVPPKSSAKLKSQKSQESLLSEPPHMSKQKRDVIRAFDGKVLKPGPGSVGKLRISSEMRNKLEQLTLDHSVRSSHKDARAPVFPFPKKKEENSSPTSSSMVPNDTEPSVKKLTETRKNIIEQKLTGTFSRDHLDASPARGRADTHFQQYDPSLELPPLPPPGLPKPPANHPLEVQSGQPYSPHTPDRIKDEDHDFSVENLVKSQVERMERASREMRERREELGHPLAHLGAVQIHPEYPMSSHASTKQFSQIPQYDMTSQASRSAIYEESLASSRSAYSSGVLPQSMFNQSAPHHQPRPSKGHGHSNMPHAQQSNYLRHQQHNLMMMAPSHAPSSSYYSPSTPVMTRRMRESPSTMKNVHQSDRIEFEESSEFLHPVDTAPPPGLDLDNRESFQDNIKTTLFGPNVGTYLTYSKVPWQLRVRKEVFAPSEKLENPLALHLVFCQIAQDVEAPACIRFNREEKRKLKQLMESFGVTLANVNSSQHKIAVKRSIVDMAKDFPNYFSRLFPVSGGRNLPNVQLLGVSHSGVRLVRRERDAICDYLRVLDTLSFEDIAEVAVPRSSTLQILLRNGGWMTLYSHKADQIRTMIERFAMEAAQGEHEFVRAVADYVTRESTLLSFQKGDVIQVVNNRNMHLDKGWLFGVLDSGESGIFPCEYVVPLGRQEIIRKTDSKIKSSVERQADSSRLETTRQGAELESHVRHEFSDTTPLWVESKVEHHDDGKSDISHATQTNDGKFSLLQFALFNFRESLDKYEMLRTRDGSIRGSVKMIETLKSQKKNKKGKDSDWTWKELSDLVKYSKSPIQASLLKFDLPELNKLSLECFIAIMRYMGDYPMAKNQSEVDCVYTILVNCHKYPQLRDEVYCQIMKQTTNNKSSKLDSCQRGWRLFSIIGAYFECTDALKLYLVKYLETAAYDKRRAFHGTAMVCLQNLRKTLKYGGRKNVPSIEEIAAISAGRNSKRQIYRLPGGTERVINTKSTTVVHDIVEEICSILNVHTESEMEEFSLYCIVEGDPYTMPLNREEYILDVTTELLKNGQIFYLIFCRSVWYFPLRLDNTLYIEVIFNQVAPDYLEGLLLIMAGDQLPDNAVPDIARVAALLHRAADMDHVPTKDEVKYLLPKPVLSSKDVRPAQWVEMVQRNWLDMTALTTTEAKAQCLDILQKWPLFGSCFFAVKWIRGDTQNPDNILALNKDGVHFLDVATHETVWKYPFAEVISTRKVRAEDGTLYLDMKCGNLMVQKITRIQTDQAHEVSRLIRQYINTEQRQRNRTRGDVPRDVTLSRHIDK